jgi:hypothetical protein
MNIYVHNLLALLLRGLIIGADKRENRRDFNFC